MEKKRPVKVAMVDDHTSLRIALGEMIDRRDDFQVILHAKNGAEFFEQLDPLNLPDLVLLDLQMKIMDGFETAERLKKEYPDISILVVTMYDSDGTLFRLVKHGVRGFVQKDVHPEDLIRAMETTIKEGYFYSNKDSATLVKLFQNGHKLLTEPELEFLKLASSRMEYKYDKIAEIMNCSARTIDNYRDSIYEKLTINSRVGLVLYAIKNGIVAPGF